MRPLARFPLALGVGGRWALGTGLVLQLALLASAQVFPRALVGDEVGYWARGTALASGLPFPPDFVWPPLYSWLIAGFVGLFGSSRLPLEIFQAALFLGCGFLLRALLLAVPLPRGPVNLATALFVLDLEAAGFTVLFWPEVLFLFLLLLGTALLFLPVEPRPRSLLAAGVCFGAAVLTKSLLGPFLPVLAVAVGFRDPELRPRTRIFRVLLLATGMAVPMVPVVVWNGVVHRHYGIAQSGLFNLWVGLNDPATKRDYDTVPGAEMSRYLASATDPGERDRPLWRKIAAKVEAESVGAILVGQLQKQYFRLFDKESFFTDLLAGGRLSGVRRTPSAGGQIVRACGYLVYASILALAALGAVLVARRELRGPLALPALFVLYNLALYLLLHVKTRYRVAFLPAMMAFAAIALARFASRESWPTPARLVPGVMLAALALFLAFSSF